MVAVATAAAAVDLVLRGRGVPQPDGDEPGERTGIGALGYDRIAHRVVALAFPFLTAGLVTGAIWAEKFAGHYWSWDPKETWSLITWLLYAAYLHAPWALPRMVRSPERRRRLLPVLLSVWLLLCFTATMVTYLGLKYLPSSSDSYHIYAE
jgi:ABC-type transport system involved in cytochrome c biogenesis permease subunit